jgi:hypothetical protein
MKFKACFALLAIASSLPAVASLGGTPDSINTDRVQLNGALATHQLASCTVQEIKMPTGTVVREYVSSAGMVFAVAWQGPFKPNLQQLFGSYFEQYAAAAKEQKAKYVGRRPMALKLPGLVVERSGYMRAEYGHAYIPQQVPAGVNVEELW